MSLVDNGSLISDRQVRESFLKNKTILDYGTITSITTDGSFCNVQLQVLDIFNGNVIQNPLIIQNAEILYLSTSSISFDTTPKAGDPVLILGLRRYIDSTKSPMKPPYAPLSPVAYERSTAKVIPLSALNVSSGLTIRAKNNKLRVRNAQVSLFKVINDFQSAVSTFSSATSQTSLSSTTPSGGGYTVALVNALNSLLGTMNSSLTTVANELSSLLED